MRKTTRVLFIALLAACCVSVAAPAIAVPAPTVEAPKAETPDKAQERAGQAGQAGTGD